MSAAADGDVPDVLGRTGEVKLLVVGINPGLRSAELGQHFARPGNRFWPALHAGGITPRQLRPHDQHLLPAFGVGITNLVGRPSATAAEVTGDELRAGARRLEALVGVRRPRVVAVLGVTAYREAFDLPRAVVGRQTRRLGDAEVWVLPNPSGLNAHTKPAEHAAGLRAAAQAAGIRVGRPVEPRASRRGPGRTVSREIL